ncbi:hypothetical protein OESDEN_06490 [Oesophagostomum dentatum]|uniref:Uncharacterized protein n=2 Tax=Oesophagostomum dentatum TaxID=61180 RepID=A0A0B1TE11_OESDE|nr:hypothetical protein OESDEN_06490 [Oesophagostomum dentatum]
MSDCYNSAKQQAYDCFDPCWKEINAYSLTEEPDKLRVCFEKRRHFVDEIINCFKTKIKAIDLIEKLKAVPTDFFVFSLPTVCKGVAFFNPIIAAVDEKC